MVLSLVMFTGASQFAFVGVAGSGGSAFAAISCGLLLGHPQRLLRRAHLGVLASARACQALDCAFRDRRDNGNGRRPSQIPVPERYAFWATGLILFSLWQIGTLSGALIGRAVNPRDVGLDAAAPAVFLALLWPCCGAARHAGWHWGAQ